jgi:hypothetical protein
MADRSFHDKRTQGIKYVDLPFRVAGANPTTNAPTFVEGDKSGASSGSYILCTKVATGKYRFKTVDKYVGLVSVTCKRNMATPTGNELEVILTPSQNADKTWQFEVWTYLNAAGTHTLTDIASADQLSVDLVMRDSSVLP